MFSKSIIKNCSSSDVAGNTEEDISRFRMNPVKTIEHACRRINNCSELSFRRHTKAINIRSVPVSKCLICHHV